jgi:hypothetical protein
VKGRFCPRSFAAQGNVPSTICPDILVVALATGAPQASTAVAHSWEAFMCPAAPFISLLQHIQATLTDSLPASRCGARMSMKEQNARLAQLSLAHSAYAQAIYSVASDRFISGEHIRHLSFCLQVVLSTQFDDLVPSCSHPQNCCQ